MAILPQQLLKKGSVPTIKLGYVPFQLLVFDKNSFPVSDTGQADVTARVIKVLQKFKDSGEFSNHHKNI